MSPPTNYNSGEFTPFLLIIYVIRHDRRNTEESGDRSLVVKSPGKTGECDEGSTVVQESVSASGPFSGPPFTLLKPFRKPMDNVYLSLINFERFRSFTFTKIGRSFLKEKTKRKDLPLVLIDCKNLFTYILLYFD